MENQNKISVLQSVLLVALVISILWLYGGRLYILVTRLAGDDDYSYGLLLPVVSTYIVYLKWPEIRRSVWRPSWAGVLLLGMGLLLLLFGELATEIYTPDLSFVVVLAGLALILGGWPLFRLVLFPLVILMLMIPLPMYLTKTLTLPLQLISSHLAAWFLQMLGYPLVQQGNIIDLGVRQLQVVAACSGLRYILALLALGLIYCYFYQRHWWKAIVLIVAMIPAAILANALRVAGMGIFPALQEGFLHSFSGWLIFVFCFGIILMINWVLDYLQPAAPADVAMKNEPTCVEKKELSSSARTFLIPMLATALALTIIAGPLASRLSQVPSTPLLQSFDNFPFRLGLWQGRRSFIDPKIFKATGADCYLNVDYTNPEHGEINLWIAYYENQKSYKVVHSPLSCLTGGGWRVLNSGTVELATGHPVKYLLMEQPGKKMLVYYWYLQRGRWLTSEYLNKLFIGYDRLLTRRSDGTLVRLITSAEPNLDAARNRLEAFGRLLIPLLPQFIKK